MRINQQFAEEFAKHWVQAWNSRNSKAILQHYADTVVFSSPFIIKAGINGTGTIYGKQNLKMYFENALEKNPDLHFELKHIMAGVKSITLIYLRKQTLLACETMLLNEEGLVAEGLSHYPAGDVSLLK